jgi:hypothetical protein
MKAKPSIMKIIYADAELMEKRRESLPPGWWIVDIQHNSFFDGPYDSKETALERYQRMAPQLRNSTPFTI